jgi:hypothetical protein
MSIETKLTQVDTLLTEAIHSYLVDRVVNKEDWNTFEPWIQAKKEIHDEIWLESFKYIKPIGKKKKIVLEMVFFAKLGVGIHVFTFFVNNQGKVEKMEAEVMAWKKK